MTSSGDRLQRALPPSTADIVEPERLHVLRDADPLDGRYVLYWMQAAVRAEHNPALEYAIAVANGLKLPLLAVFGLTDGYPDANLRHYAFLLEGLKAAQQALRRRGIRLVVRRAEPDKAVAELAGDAAAVITDIGYLRHQRGWRRRVAASTPAPVTAVEGEVVVPVATASGKREYAARTLRPKLEEHAERFLQRQRTVSLKRDSLSLKVRTVRLGPALLDRLDIDRSVRPLDTLDGGTPAARGRLRRFLAGGLRGYDAKRNQPQDPHVSRLATYLNYGQISPVSIALAIREADAPSEDRDAFLEELIVRRELAVNYVLHEPHYDRYRGLPGWAQETLAEHSSDERAQVYTRRELEEGQTHDRYWNAAMLELVELGYMHNHMRMYWGKKVLEWTRTPAYAFSTLLYLNNRFALDGRSAATFANVAWVFGLHDQAWTERKVFGKVRYMNENGLKRKCDPDAYVERIARSIGRAVPPCP